MTLPEEKAAAGGAPAAAVFYRRFEDDAVPVAARPILWAAGPRAGRLVA
jgi:hypothetical protein